jgi:hypothetical protein
LPATGADLLALTKGSPTISQQMRFFTKHDCILTTNNWYFALMGTAQDFKHEAGQLFLSLLLNR